MDGKNKRSVTNFSEIYFFVLKLEVLKKFKNLVG
jgi:hypothetical protein